MYIFGSFSHHFGVTLGSLWGHFGVTLGSLWDHFGVTLGSLWGHFGITLGTLWASFWADFVAFSPGLRKKSIGSTPRGSKIKKWAAPGPQPKSVDGHFFF